MIVFVAYPKQRRQRLQRGFTLVELMIVVLIIGVLLNMAMPQFIHARDVAQANACVTNLHNINAAKEQWAMQTNASSTSTPTEAQIQPYIHTGTFPACPTAGQAYNINSMSLVPSCPYGKATNAPAHVF